MNLEVRFQFGSFAKDLLFGPAFELICGQLLDAVVKRTRALSA